MASAENTPPRKAAEMAGRQSSLVGFATEAMPSEGESTDTSASSGSGSTKRIWGVRQPKQNGVPSATAKPQLGQEWSTAAKLQEMASHGQEIGDC
jgi:hypothetical protein